MFKWAKQLSLTTVGFSALLCASVVGAQDAPQAIGRTATEAEIQAWNIDVRPDFQGLPKGQGTVDEGEELWENTCAVCHGTFAESNLFFTPLIGGTTYEDIETGKVASLISPTQDSRTAIMVVPTVSTLWDYIYRAMPWDNPRTLEPDEVYSALAYLLNLADIIDYDFVLSDETIAEVQERMPNRNNVVFWEGLWSVDGKPDVENVACMSDCVDEVVITSELPERARDAHGDLAAQNRVVGPVRGANTLEPPLTGPVSEHSAQVREYAYELLQVAIADESAGDTFEGQVMAAIRDNSCLACHDFNKRLVGPGFVQIANKYEGEAVESYLANKIKKGGGGVWGAIPMPPNASITEKETQLIVEWLMAGAPN